MKSFHPEE